MQSPWVPSAWRPPPVRDPMSHLWFLAIDNRALTSLASLSDEVLGSVIRSAVFDIADGRGSAFAVGALEPVPLAIRLELTPLGWQFFVAPLAAIVPDLDIDI